MRPTRERRTGRPRMLSYLVLLRPGFAEPARSPGPLVVSYTTVSPLPVPERARLASHRRTALCGTVPKSPPLGFPQWPALWSPDFPRRNYLRDSLALSSLLREYPQRRQ